MIEAWRHHRAVGNAVVMGLIGVFLLLLLANLARTGQLVSEIRHTQLANTSLAQDTHESTALIRSCVTPGGKCYERGRKQTGTAVSTLNTYVLLSASCTAHIATATHGLQGISQTELTKLITACVRSQLMIADQRK